MSGGLKFNRLVSLVRTHLLLLCHGHCKLAGVLVSGEHPVFGKRCGTFAVCAIRVDYLSVYLLTVQEFIQKLCAILINLDLARVRMATHYFLLRVYHLLVKPLLRILVQVL